MMKFLMWVKNLFLKTKKEEVKRWNGYFFFPLWQDDWLLNACDIANECLHDESFLDEIRAVKKFDFTNDSGVEVINKLLEKKTAYVSTYKSKNPFSKSIAYTNGQFIYLNTRRNPRKIVELVNTLLHERCHVVGYEHGDNSSKGKENSVPYLIGTKSEKFVKVCQNSVRNINGN